MNKETILKVLITTLTERVHLDPEGYPVIPAKDVEIELLSAYIADRLSQDWVKVEDRLPELDKEVLLFDDWRKKEGKPGDIRTGYLSEFTTRKTSEGEKKYCEWGGTEFAFNITHWMPLPQNPD